MHIEVTKAKQTLERLEADLVKAADRATALQVERRRLSFSALAGDNKPARAKLDKLNAESLTASLESANLGAAIDQARSNLAAAEHHASLAAQRAKATEALALAEQAAKRGARIRDLTQELSAEISRAIGDLRRFSSMGAPVMNARMLELALTRSVLPQLREAGIDCDLIPPGSRHQADAIVDGYIAQATRWADGVLGAREAA